MNPKRELPGCGLEKVLSDKSYPTSNGFQRVHACPRNADAHELCRKLAESEAKVKALNDELAALRSKYESS